MSDRRLPLPLFGSHLEHCLPDIQPGQVHDPSYPCQDNFDVGGQLPQEGEGNGQVDQEGAAGDGGGKEQGGGQASAAGAIHAICAICMVYEEGIGS